MTHIRGQLRADIPVANMTNLRYLNMRDNLLSGGLPLTAMINANIDSTSITNNHTNIVDSALVHLDLAHNMIEVSMYALDIY